MATECNVDIGKEGYLLEIIEDTIKEFKTEIYEIWEFRVPVQGSSYWVSSKTRSPSQAYPYLDQVLEKIEQARNNAKELKNSELCKIPKKIEEIGGTEVYQKTKEEASKFISTIMRNKYSNTSQNVEAYNLKDLANFIGKTLTKEEALDILFACPFEFVEQEIENVQDEPEEKKENDDNQVRSEIKIELTKENQDDKVVKIKAEQRGRRMSFSKKASGSLPKLRLSTFSENNTPVHREEGDNLAVSIVSLLIKFIFY